MNKYYTSELHTRMLIALLKEHGIKKVVASPGATNVCFVASIQSDSYFEIYSSIDERSAAYIACGLAAECGEPVALSCTGATASRNYIPGLTEAYYRHLPVLAITASQPLGRIGNLYPQVVDRSRQLNDITKISVNVEPIHDDEEEWDCQLKINKALIALRRNGGGPVHINLVTTYSRDYSFADLPKVKKIDYITYGSEMPSLSNYKRIAILVGVHQKWSDDLTDAVDSFCKKYNAVVLMNHASNYKGNYGVLHAITLKQYHFDNSLANADLVIYIGSVSRYKSGMKNAHLWKVGEDGSDADSEKNLTIVFQMDEKDFFDYYNSQKCENIKCENDNIPYANKWQNLYEETIRFATNIPFSNVWIAQNTIVKLPRGSVLHIAGSNTARAWNFFELDKSLKLPT